MTTMQQARNAIACLVHECDEVLDLEPQVKRVTIDLESGCRLRVSRKKAEIGRKGGMRDITEQALKDSPAALFADASEGRRGAEAAIAEIVLTAAFSTKDTP